jgi:N-acetylglucosaminyl-diphospho-decaprenol L-rhamnosyltransferase
VVGTVHVVTVTHNSAETLDGYFQGIAANADRIARVTVVDNASTDATVELVRRAAAGCPVAVDVIENANTGFAGGYAAAARSDVQRGLPVLAVNPDVVLAPDTVRALLDVAATFPSAAVVTAPLVEVDGTPDTASRRRLPTFGASVVYSMLGRLTPDRLRYNARSQGEKPTARTSTGIPVSELQATTGALMLVSPDFRSLDQGVFDRRYWMYGEDLQLCADAATAGRSVLMAEIAPSVHVKGVSSGRPRSHRSNRAFHEAMWIYARTNLVRSPVASSIVRMGVGAHFAVSELQALPTRLRRRRGR